MYRIMLADDEGLELTALKYMIERKFGNQCEIQTTRSGRGAIELADSFRPDIAIMDIQMPGINGIYAMQEILPKHPDMHFIVLSAYDNFDYAQQSIKLGVQEYLTKPVKKDLLIKTLENVMERIDGNRKRRKNDLQLREKLETALPMLEHGFIYSVIMGLDTAGLMEQYQELLGIHQQYGCFLVLAAQLPRKNTDSIQWNLNLNGMYEHIRSLAHEIFSAVCGPLMGDKVLCVVLHDAQEEEYSTRLHMIEQARELNRRLTRAVGQQFQIGIGSVVPIKELERSYKQAINALRQNKDAVCHFNDLPLQKSWEKGYPADLEYRLYEEVSRGDHNAIQTAEQFFDWMLMIHGENVTDVKLKTLEQVLQCEHRAFHTGGREYRFMERHGYLEQINETNEMKELKQWFQERIRNALESVHSSKEDQTIGMVKRAEQYIQQHYTEELTLNRVSEIVHVSPPYISKLFKEKLGMTFLEYLTRIRMEKAKQMLRETQESIRRIGCEVGYQDPNYFSRAFKKYVGVTPREYRDNGSNIE